MQMKTSKWLAVVTAMALTSSVSWGTEDVKVDVEKEEIGKPMPIQVHGTGELKTRPQSVFADESAGATVTVENVSQFKGKGIVVKDNSPEKHAGMSFVTIFTNKVKIHFLYLGMDSAGNTFVSFTNNSGEPIFHLMFKDNLTDFVVIAGENKLISGVLTDGVPAAVDIVLDIPAWKYTVDINGKNVASGAMIAAKEKGLVYTTFATVASTTASFAIKDIAIAEAK